LLWFRVLAEYLTSELMMNSSGPGLRHTAFQTSNNSSNWYAIELHQPRISGIRSARRIPVPKRRLDCSDTFSDGDSQPSVRPMYQDLDSPITGRGRSRTRLTKSTKVSFFAVRRHQDKNGKHLQGCRLVARGATVWIDFEGHQRYAGQRHKSRPREACHASIVVAALERNIV
jgi:hypothetical protein